MLMRNGDLRQVVSHAVRVEQCAELLEVIANYFPSVRLDILIDGIAHFFGHRNDEYGPTWACG